MTNFKLQKSIKLFLSLSVVVMLAAGCTKAQLQQNNQQASQPVSTGQTQTKQNAAGPDYFPGGQKPGNLTVQQTVEGSSLNQPSYQIAAGETAMDLLKATNQAQVKSYGSMGEFVESIDGIKPDNKHFWEFFVNGKSSNVGASSYTLKDGDKIEWKLSAIK